MTIGVGKTGTGLGAGFLSVVPHIVCVGCQCVSLVVGAWLNHGLYCIDSLMPTPVAMDEGLLKLSLKDLTLILLIIVQ